MMLGREGRRGRGWRCGFGGGGRRGDGGEEEEGGDCGFLEDCAIRFRVYSCYRHLWRLDRHLIPRPPHLPLPDRHLLSHQNLPKPPNPPTSQPL